MDRLYYSGISGLLPQIKFYKQITDDNPKYVIEDSDENIISLTESELKTLFKMLTNELVKGE